MKYCNTVMEQHLGAIPEIIDCEIYNNQSNGIVIGNFSKPKITNCKIHANNSKEKYYPGIIAGHNSEPEVTGCEIYNQSIGILIVQEAKGTYKNCKIHDNGDKAIKVDKKGIKNVFSGVKISSCEEWNNDAIERLQRKLDKIDLNIDLLNKKIKKLNSKFEK